jgi:DNA-binding transcriptional MerR regulator
MSDASTLLWTIDQLSTQAALALSVDYDGQGNGQVREVPDLRTIRYYTTLGLIDRPTAMRGRTALYGRRHLLQLVAIKRLQARGYSLAELQQQLLGQTDAELARLAQLPGLGETPQALPERRTEAFWTQPPALLAKADESELRDEAESLSDQPLQGVRLSGDVTLLLAPARPLDNADLEAIRAVAAPLLKLLEKRRLLRQTDERNPE